LEFLSGLALIFSYWLFFQSVYVIQILCPWCLLVTFSTTIIFATVTCYMLHHNSLNLKHSTQKKVDKFLDQGYEVLIPAIVVVILAILVYLKFGDSLFLS
ncbi:MAG TPA: vitamin K epoxide reductase family protein, partial [Chitinophagaceae bacterium]|nr:vitamin K epoxide reductase family protein [Chitinophagaceae bacterium]